MEIDNKGRYYINPYAQQLSTLPDSFPASLLADIDSFLLQSYEMLEVGLRTYSKNDLTLYTGSVGIGLTLARLKCALQHTAVREYPRLQHSASGLQWHGIGINSSGLCYEMYRCLTEGEAFDITERLYCSRQENDEALTGRCGLLMMLDYYTQKGMITRDTEIIQKVAASIKLSEFPWSWHKKVYYGAAHGTSGIMFALKRICGVEHVDLAETLVSRASLDSGNFKSSESSTNDELVQWCHGAPGFIPFLLEYAVLSELAASKIGPGLNVIWERGLLAKGCSICHGIAGNAYCFLAAYLATGNQMHLLQACCFTVEILRLGPQYCCAEADHQLSLFEGLAGVVQFLLDLTDIIRIADADELQKFKLFDGLAIF
jgi:lantibiotic modifying enzyme